MHDILSIEVLHVYSKQQGNQAMHKLGKLNYMDFAMVSNKMHDQIWTLSCNFYWHLYCVLTIPQNFQQVLVIILKKCSHIIIFHYNSRPLYKCHSRMGHTTGIFTPRALLIPLGNLFADRETHAKEGSASFISFD